MSKTGGCDHNIDAFTMWMAEAGAKKGYIRGETDERSYRFQGREFRFTDVRKKIVKEILA